jgi:hypothetical protein
MKGFVQSGQTAITSSEPAARNARQGCTGERALTKAMLALATSKSRYSEPCGCDIAAGACQDTAPIGPKIAMGIFRA